MAYRNGNGRRVPALHEADDDESIFGLTTLTDAEPGECSEYAPTQRTSQIRPSRFGSFQRRQEGPGTE